MLGLRQYFLRRSPLTAVIQPVTSRNPTISYPINHRAPNQVQTSKTSRIYTSPNRPQTCTFRSQTGPYSSRLIEAFELGRSVEFAVEMAVDDLHEKFADVGKA
jgi:hypothetical protein